MNKKFFEEHIKYGSLRPGTRIEIDWDGHEKGKYTGTIIKTGNGSIDLDYGKIGGFYYEYILVIAPAERKDGFIKRRVKKR